MGHYILLQSSLFSTALALLGLKSTRRIVLKLDFLNDLPSGLLSLVENLFLAEEVVEA